MPLDEWQDVVLEAAMGERADGRWASKFVGLSAPRQNGKSQLIVARALAGVLLFGEKMIIISAHETDTAREVWKRLIDVIEDNPTLEARVSGRMDAINREYVSFGRGLDKQTIKLKARRKSGTRGFSADCLLLDEGQMLPKPAWGSILPTMAARARVTTGGPQLWLFGTPPTPDDDPFAFARVRESARAHKARHCWVEWSADPTDDFDDEATWAKANPSYGVRVHRNEVADERANMDDDQFALERLGIWESVVATSAFPAGAWERCSSRPNTGVLLETVGVSVAPDLSVSGLVGAGWDGDRVQVKPLQHAEGTAWVVARCKSLQDAHGCDVVIDGGGPGAVLVPHFEQEGVRVTVAKTGDVLDACATTFDLVRERLLSHDDFPDLNAAVAGAKKRKVRDRWAWERTAKSEPLEAMTLAAWALSRPESERVSAYADHDLIVI